MATASEEAVASSQPGGTVLPAGTFALHLGMTLALILISAIAWYSESMEVAIDVAVLAFVVNLFLVIIEVHSILVQKGRLAPLLIVGGTFFWFIIDATVLALGDVPFSSRYPLYPFFTAGIPVDVVCKTLFGVFLFQACGLLGLHYLWVPRHAIERFARRKDILTGTAMDLACLFISALAYIPIAIIAGDWTQILNRLVEMRNAEASVEFSGAEPGLWIHLTLLGIFAGSISSARFLLGIRGNNFVRLATVGITALWVFLSGTRFLMIFLVLPSLVLLTNQTAGRARATHLRLKLFAVVAVAGIAILVQAAIRTTGVEGYSGYQRASDVIRGGAVGYEHFEAMAIAIDLADREGSYFHEFLLPVIATHFVPRVWWPEKPDWESWSYYNEAVTGSTASFNVTPSVTGEYYLNWGLWGIVYIGFFFGWLGRCADEWLQKVSLSEGLSSAVFAGFFFGFLFVSFRILSPIYIAYVVGAAIVLFLLTTSGKRIVLSRST